MLLRPSALVVLLLALASLGSARTVGDELADLIRRARGAPSPPERIEALEAIAGLTGGDDRPKRAQALASALDDESTDVRVRGIQLLVDAGEHDIAIVALVKATKAVSREKEAQRKALDKYGRRRPPAFDPNTTHEKRMRDLEALRAWSAEGLKITERLAALQSVSSALASAFVALPDDRGVGALGDLLADAPAGADADALVEALLGLGTGDALRQVAAYFPRVEKARGEVEGRVKKARRAKPGRKPKGRAKDEWEASEKQRLAKAVARHEEGLAALDAWSATLAERLAAFATEHGLAPPPEAALPARPWRDWSTKQALLLPARVAAADGR
ncbi:MAG: hypothetical protein AAF682_16805 [Planctomycetota bacterium]